jgi:hypothetical protein
MPELINMRVRMSRTGRWLEAMKVWRERSSRAVTRRERMQGRLSMSMVGVSMVRARVRGRVRAGTLIRSRSTFRTRIRV